MGVFDNIASGVNAAATEDAITINVNPSTGFDKSVPVTSQAQATALGDFKSADGVANALPDKLKHNITLQYPAGDFDLTALGQTLGDWKRKSQAAGLLITIKGAGLEQVPGSAASYTITAGGANTVDVASGLGVDVFRGDMVRILTGPAAGVIRPIRTHSDTQIEIPGHWDGGPNPTSGTFDIVRQQTRLAGMAGQSLNGGGFVRTAFQFEDLDLIGDLSAQFRIGGVELTTLRTRFSKLPLDMENTALRFQDATIIDGDGAGAFGWPGIVAQRQSSVSSVNNAIGFLIRDFAFYAILSFSGSFTFLFDGTIDDIADFAFLSAAIAAGNFSDGTVNLTRLRGSGFEHFLHLGQQAATAPAYADMQSYTLAEGADINGTVGLVIIDGDSFSNADIDALGLGNTIIGSQGSVFTRAS